MTANARATSVVAIDAFALLIGDEATLIRFNHNIAVEWMTGTDEAFASLDALLDLDPPGGTRVSSAPLVARPRRGSGDCNPSQHLKKGS